ncbi:MAG: hypothetical protein CMN28_01590 [Salinisphaeraceae bacterium]|nr:hypothetical protein [Salinisphaeraceae bacterium]
MDLKLLDYPRYFLSTAVVLLSTYGLLLGGNYSWMGLGILMGILLFDSFLESDYSMRDQRHPVVYDIVVGITLLAGVAHVFTYAYLAGAGHFATWSSEIGAFVSVAMVGFVVGAPPLHELFHRETFVQRWMGRIGNALIFDPWREITHVVTHHTYVCTPDDPDYARRGENMYRHVAVSLYRQFKESYQLEKQMWTKRGRAWWHPKNAWVWRASILLGFSTLLFIAGGFKGMLLAIATCLIGPRTFLEIFNYCNHYGLISATPGRFENRHTWNHLTPFVRVFALEITNHAGHHTDSYVPFYELEPDEGGPEQPQFMICVLLALVPPLFFAMIKPRLAHWDRHFATDEEREIAWRENARAGWHDLNEAMLADERPMHRPDIAAAAA